MSGVARTRVLIGLAFRNFVLHRVKTLIIGTIMVFGSFLFVVGTALLDSLEVSMSKSIVSSLAGHLHLYSKDAKDELALFGGLIMGVEDIGTIEDIKRVREAVLQVENVRSIVPMGIDQGTVTTGNELDRALEGLREAVKTGDADGRREGILRLRAMAGTLEGELENEARVSKDAEKLLAKIADVHKIREDEFWAGFEENPELALTFLDTKIAPLAEAGLMLFLRYVGTDLEKFQENFDRFEIVRGEVVPPGRRGILINERVYQEEIKNVVARELDALVRAVTEDEKKIAGDPILEGKVKHTANAYDSILFQLGPSDQKLVSAELAKVVGPGELRAQLKKFLEVDDENIVERHKLFYEVVAPRIRVYEFAVGDVMTLRTYTRSGFMNSANVKIYGTYRFKGLERSQLAGGHNLVDLVTFRELFGQMTTAQKAELADIRASIDAKDVSREDAEAALFGGGDSLVEEIAAPAAGSDVEATIDAAASKREAAPAAEAPYTREEIEKGLALSAAVMLHDASRLAETRARLEPVAASLGLKVVDWQAASGLIGQFIMVVRGILYIAIIITFLVALVIINNSMVMAMQDRVAEIGTMRAIGAQRSFVMGVFVGESVALGLIAGAIGVIEAGLLMWWLGSAGIPAVDDVTVFLFAGPRFFPTITIGNMLFGFSLIVLIGVVSTLYPAKIATSIQPVVAMRGKAE